MAQSTTSTKKIKSIYDVVHETHHVKVRECEYCGKPMSASDVNDYGSLCESCYMKEYYGDEYDG